MATAGSKRKLALSEPAIEDGCRHSPRLRNTNHVNNHVTNLGMQNYKTKVTDTSPQEKIEIVVEILDSNDEADISSSNNEENPPHIPPASPCMNAREKTGAAATCKISIDSLQTFAKKGTSTPNLTRNDKGASSISSCQTNITGGFEVGSLHKLTSEVECLENGGDLSRYHVMVVEENNEMHILKDTDEYGRLDPFQGESDPCDQNDIYYSPAASFQNMSNEVEEMKDTGHNAKETKEGYSDSNLHSPKGKENGGGVGQNCNATETTANQSGCSMDLMRRGRGRPRKLGTNLPVDCHITGVVGCSKVPMRRGRGRPRKLGNNVPVDCHNTGGVGCSKVPMGRGRGRPRKLENNVPVDCNITGGFEEEEMGDNGQNEKEVEDIHSHSSLFSKTQKENCGVGQNCNIAETATNQTACPEISMKHDRIRQVKLENNVDTEGTCKQNTCAGAIDKSLEVNTSAIDKPLKENISLSQVPTSTVKLLSTGLLEGYSVEYLYRNETLMGTIVGEGILCQCIKCMGKQVVNLTSFEKHARSGAKRPSDYIRFKNGTSFTQLVRVVSNTRLDKIPDVIKSTLEIVSSKIIDSSGQAGEFVDFSSQPQLQQMPSMCDLDPSRHTMIHEKDTVMCDLDPSRHTIIHEKDTVKEKTPFSKFRKSDSECDHVKKTKRGRPPNKNILPLEAPVTYLRELLNWSNLFNIPSASKKSKETSLHKLIFMPGSGIPDGTLLSYYMKGQHFLDGYKQDFGILCSCCNEVVSCSLFEVHAGWGTRKSPYNHIYLSDGRTLHEVALSIANETRISEKEDPSYNEDFCALCGDGGHLLCCDGCTKSFHKECLGIRHEPVSRYWFCPSHRVGSLIGGKAPEKDSCKFSRKFGRRAFKGRPPKLLTRVVSKAADNNGGGCVLCRHEEFTKYGFDDHTILFCDQCEKEFHVGCLRDHGISDLKDLPKGNWFCSNDCSEIHKGLQKHIANGSISLPSYISESIRMKVQNDVDQGLQDDIKWQILHGKTKDLDSRDLLSEAEAIFHDRFESIVDPSTGRDLIPLMLYSKSMRDQDFGGMYSAVLTVNSEVVSAAVFRVFGQQIAELPLVATRAKSQGQGYFHSLFSCIEELFSSLNIKHIVLPAAEEVESFWTNKFGFIKMSREQLNKQGKDLQIMVFKGASMLEKELAPSSKNES